MVLEGSDFPLAIFFGQSYEERETDRIDDAGEVVQGFVSINVSWGQSSNANVIHVLTYEGVA